MTETEDSRKRPRSREIKLFLTLLLVGLVLLPGVIYVVGHAIFGDFGGSGLASFYRSLIGELVTGEPGAWFLILSPYLVWQTLRATTRAFRTR